MPKKIQCNLTKEELEILYYKEGLTQKQLAPILGVKSDITVRKILHNYSIDTNRNQKISNLTKKQHCLDMYNKMRPLMINCSGGKDSFIKFFK